MICLGAGLAGWKLRQQRAEFLAKSLDIHWLNSLSWQDFERQVGEVYRERGYWVHEVGGGGADSGVDLWLRRDGQTAIVQCKRWKTYKVGVKPVRELFGVMTAENAGRANFITSGVYTDEALRFAVGKPMELDCAQRAEMMRRFQTVIKPAPAPAPNPESKPHPTPPTPARMAAPTIPKCPKCNNAMVLRRASSGPNTGKEFWGCSTFAQNGCRGTRQIG